MQIYFLLIIFTQNNIFLNIVNYKGDMVSWKSIGMFKSKNLKKLNNSTIKSFILTGLSQINKISLPKLHVRLKGFNKCKKSFLRIFLSLYSEKILSISENSMKSNNGCKLKKRRRL